MNRTLFALALAAAALASPAIAQDAPGGLGQPVNTVPEPGSAALALLALGAGVANRVRAARRRRNDTERRG